MAWLLFEITISELLEVFIDPSWLPASKGVSLIQPTDNSTSIWINDPRRDWFSQAIETKTQFKSPSNTVFPRNAP